MSSFALWPLKQYPDNDLSLDGVISDKCLPLHFGL
jgi:hypothetical protein